MKVGDGSSISIVTLELLFAGAPQYRQDWHSSVKFQAWKGYHPSVERTHARASAPVHGWTAGRFPASQVDIGFPGQKGVPSTDCSPSTEPVERDRQDSSSESASQWNHQLQEVRVEVHPSQRGRSSSICTSPVCSTPPGQAVTVAPQLKQG